MKKKIVALLPMKANSERVPGKNFKDLNGKPLFRWVLDTLLSVDIIDSVIINTDARDILSTYGLESSERVLIRDRRQEICGDDVSMNKVIGDDIAAIDSDVYLMTHTTNPMLSRSTIVDALSKFSESLSTGEHDSLFSVDKIQTRFYKKDGTPINHNPDKLIKTQDLEPWFEENSNLYLFTKESFESTQARIGKKPFLFETPKGESVDIDTPDDWEIARKLQK